MQLSLIICTDNGRTKLNLVYARNVCSSHYASDLSDAMSMTKRYLTSAFRSLS